MHERWPGETRGVAIDDYEKQKTTAIDEGTERIKDIVAEATADGFLKGYEMGVADARAHPRIGVFDLIESIKEVLAQRKKERGRV